jgi:hypothetical protein
MMPGDVISVSAKIAEEPAAWRAYGSRVKLE